MKPPGDGVHYDIVANFGELLFNDEPNASKDRHFWFGSSNSGSVHSTESVMGYSVLNPYISDT